MIRKAVESIHIMSIVLSIASVIIVIGCGSTIERPVRVQLTPAESIDPFAYGDEFARPGSDNIISSPITAQQVQQDSIPENQTIPQQQLTRPRPVTDGNIYRIQLGVVFENREEAESYARMARNRLDGEITVEYRAPFYRVYAGSFSTEYEASSYLQQLREKGFRESRMLSEPPTAQ